MNVNRKWEEIEVDEDGSLAPLAAGSSGDENDPLGLGATVEYVGS